MKRLILASVMVVAISGGALAQPVTSGTTTKQPTGLSKPPAGAAPATHKRLDRTNSSALGNNTPTLPQIALHPTATIGSPVPVAGPGGTSTNPTGD